MIFIFLFFFYFNHDNRDLPSFPTRRSSDLLEEHFYGLGEKADRLDKRRQRYSMWARDFASYDRSEEHTSELQSLRHLVCRLLLEKKKNIIKYRNLKLIQFFNICVHSTVNYS